MELGSGVGLGALCVSCGAVAITAIRTFCKPTNGNGSFSQKLCDEKHKSIDGWLEGIDSKVDQLITMHLKE